jgi:putative pyridoxal-dependent aspartate 1-decarboxylase
MIKEALDFFSDASEVTRDPRLDLLLDLRSLAELPSVSTPCIERKSAEYLVEAFVHHQSLPFRDYLEFLGESVIRHSTNVASPRCMGNMTSILLKMMPTLGDVVLTLNQNLVKREASTMFTLIEHQVLSMLHRYIYRLPQDFYERHSFNQASTLGIVLLGATLGNLTALWIARNRCFGPCDGFAGIEREGVSAALEHYRCGKAVIIASKLAHYSINKAASILGLGEDGVISVKVERDGRVSVRSLQETVFECHSRNWQVIAILGIAGTTDCGSIDPLKDIAGIADESKIHFHVDAAWGMPLLFSRQHQHELDGLDLADSVTVDGHKQLYLPIGTSALLLRDPAAASVIEKQTMYMLREGSGDLGKRCLEGSRPGVALFLHAGLSVIGAEGYELLLDESIRLARVMAEKLEQHEQFQLLMKPKTNIVVYRYIPPEFRVAATNKTLRGEENAIINSLNVKIQETQSKHGRAYVSRTTLDFTTTLQFSVVALRAVIMNPFTTESDIDFVLQDQLAIAAAILPVRFSPGFSANSDFEQAPAARTVRLR